MNIERTLKEAAERAVADAVKKVLHQRLPAAEYLTTPQAASYLGLSTQFLEIARHQGEGPPYIKLSRIVKYAKRDLDAWMEQQKVMREDRGGG